jgi:regulatory protein
MRKITALQVQKRNPSRVNIHLDGKFAFGVDRMAAAWLKVGQELGEEKIKELQAEDTSERAFQQALLFLSYRIRSEYEIRRNLEKHKFPEAVVEATIERLRREGLANDKQFAQLWVENRSTFRPRGRRALALELRQKGIPDPTIQAIIETVDDESLAYSAARQKAHKLPVQEWAEFRKKLSGFLARRGFSYSIIKPIVLRVWDELQSEGEPQYLENEDHP